MSRFYPQTFSLNSPFTWVLHAHGQSLLCLSSWRLGGCRMEVKTLEARRMGMMEKTAGDGLAVSHKVSKLGSAQSQQQKTWQLKQELGAERNAFSSSSLLTWKVTALLWSSISNMIPCSKPSSEKAVTRWKKEKNWDYSDALKASHFISRWQKGIEAFFYQFTHSHSHLDCDEVLCSGWEMKVHPECAKETPLPLDKRFAQKFAYTNRQPLPRLMCVVVQPSSCSFIVHRWVGFSVDCACKCATQINI